MKIIPHTDTTTEPTATRGQQKTTAKNTTKQRKAKKLPLNDPKQPTIMSAFATKTPGPRPDNPPSGIG